MSDKDRSEFEKAARGIGINCTSRTPFLSLRGQYLNADMSNAWRLWQAALVYAREAEQTAWADTPDKWSDEIVAAHPMKTGDHDTRAIANEMVSNRHSKFALIDLVNWLLARIKKCEAERKPGEDVAALKERLEHYIELSAECDNKSGSHQYKVTCANELHSSIDDIIAIAKAAIAALEGKQNERSL